jgi:hypothetical protein
MNRLLRAECQHHGTSSRSWDTVFTASASWELQSQQSLSRATRKTRTDQRRSRTRAASGLRTLHKRVGDPRQRSLFEQLRIVRVGWVSIERCSSLASSRPRIKRHGSRLRCRLSAAQSHHDATAIGSRYHSPLIRPVVLRPDASACRKAGPVNGA